MVCKVSIGLYLLRDKNNQDKVTISLQFSFRAGIEPRLEPLNTFLNIS